ncbi:MAG: hypothetical protein HKM93_09755 [Desulfobacteraceae bacterium]|nr:hypothetical protein [Desulfobacteraceae bacterium]
MKAFSTGSGYGWLYALVPIILVSYLASGAAISAAATGDDLKGASAVIDQVLKSLDQNSPGNSGDPYDLKAGQLKQSALAFSVEKTAMAPDVAARKWIALFDAYMKLPRKQSVLHLESLPLVEKWTDQPFSIWHLFEAIPGPPAWDDILNILETRSGADKSMGTYVLRLIFYYLNNDFHKFEKGLVSTELPLEGLDEYQQENYRRGLEHVENTFRRSMLIRSPEDAAEQFKQVFSDQNPQGRGSMRVVVPDLLSIMTEAEASELLKKAMTAPKTILLVHTGGKMKTLVKRTILDNVGILETPQWAMVDSMEDTALYEAMAGRFDIKPVPPSEEDIASIVEHPFYDDTDNYLTGSRESATSYYILGLIAQDRMDEAVAITLAPREEGSASNRLDGMFQGIDLGRLAPGIYTYCRRIHDKNPDRTPWRLYMASAFSVGKIEEMISTLKQKQSDRNHIKQWIQTCELLSKAYLMNDDIEQAMAVYKDIQALTLDGVPVEQHQRLIESQFESALNTVRLGRLLQHPAAIETGMRQLEDILVSAGLAAVEVAGFNARFINSLIASKKYARAEKQIAAALEKRLQSGENRYGYGQDDCRSLLFSLMNIYHDTGRDEDVVDLLRNAPWWEAEDLSDLIVGGDESVWKIASSLHRTGHGEAAVILLKTAIYIYPKADSLYETLIRINPDDLSKWLDGLYERDRFEERPLIWKAYLQYRKKDLDAAEQTIRLALKVDPTDGEQREGDRVRAYGILGDILSAKGKTEDADFFHNVVKSVRMAEEGDDLERAGLISRSLKKYMEAEVLFGDAYCVQWRLAERLTALGRHEEAKNHYKIAFERMPEQFGQVASFCFGCEGAFDKPASRTVAEEVLDGLMKTEPGRPQVWFLAGQLKEAKGEYQAAFDLYEKAMALDPEYLDALEKVYGLNEVVFLPQSDKDDLIFAASRLDPLGRHFGGDLGMVADVKRAWKVAARNQKYRVDLPKTIFRLGAAQKELKRKETIREQHEGSAYDVHGYSFFKYLGSAAQPLRPEQLLQRIYAIEKLIQMMIYRSY